MRPKNKVSDWLAKKSEDGSVNGDEGSDVEKSDVASTTSQADSDIETDEEEDAEFDLELIERKLLRSRPVDRIHYLKNELHSSITCEFSAGVLSEQKDVDVTSHSALSASDSPEVVFILLEGLLRHSDEGTHDAIIDVLLQILRTSEMQVTEDLVAWVYEQTTSMGSPSKTYVLQYPPMTFFQG